MSPRTNARHSFAQMPWPAYWFTLHTAHLRAHPHPARLLSAHLVKSGEYAVQLIAREVPLLRKRAIGLALSPVSKQMCVRVSVSTAWPL